MMFSLGFSKEVLLAKDVCNRLTKVITDDPDHGELIAIKSADVIIEEVRHQLKNESLVKAIKNELTRCHPNSAWTFKED